MLASFKFINLHTEYSAEGPVPHEMQRRPCYGTIVGDLKRHEAPLTQTYHIRISNTVDSLKKNQNNFNFLNIDKYLSYLNQIFDFEYSIDDDKGNGRRVLNLTISNYPGIYHVFILTHIRPLYEYPYNWAMYDAVQLMDSGECPGLNILDCFNLCLCSSNLEYYGGHNCLRTHDVYKPICKKELFNRLKSTNVLNNIYPNLKYKYEQVVTMPNKEVHIENLMNLYYKRHKKYVENYKLLKKYVE